MFTQNPALTITQITPGERNTPTRHNYMLNAIVKSVKTGEKYQTRPASLKCFRHRCPIGMQHRMR